MELVKACIPDHSAARMIGSVAAVPINKAGAAEV